MRTYDTVIQLALVPIFSRHFYGCELYFLKELMFKYMNVFARVKYVVQGCHVSGKSQGKTKCSPGQGIVREF